jgi:hypothetical protein
VDSAEIEVRVTAPSAPATAGLVVELTPVAGPGASWSLPVRRSRVRLGEVAPGPHRLSVAGPGLATVETELTVAAGERLAFEVVLEPTGAAARSRIAPVERRPAAPGQAFDEDLLRDLPSGRNAWSLLETVDGTSVLDRMENGGLYVGEPGRVGVHGSSWTQVGYRLDGLDLTDPQGAGTPLLHPDLAGLVSVRTVSAALPVEIGPPGVSLVLSPRRPTSAWQGSAEGYAVPAGWQPSPSGQVPPIARFDGLAGGEVRAEGPLVADRLGLAVAGSLARSRRVERRDVGPVEGRSASVRAHLVWVATPRDEVRFILGAQDREQPDPARARLGETAREGDTAWDVRSTWERHGSSGFGVSVGYGRGSFDPDGRQPLAASIERLRDGAVPSLFPGRGRSASAQVQAHLDLQPLVLGAGSHALRFGLSGARRNASTRPPGPRSLTAETVAGLPARVWDYGWAGPESEARATDVAAWAADQARYGRLALEAGLRFETTKGSSTTGPARISWASVSPRVQARLSLVGPDRLDLVAGGGRYRHRLPLDWLGVGDTAGPQGAVYRWEDGNRDGVLDPGETGALVTRVGPGSSVAAVDPDLKRPWTDEVLVGLESRWGGSWSARVLALHRRENDLVASVNTGVGIADYDRILVPDPSGDILGPGDDQLLPLYDRRPESFGRDRYLLTNPGDGSSLHESVEVELTRRLGARFWLHLGAMTLRTNGPGASRGFRADENDQGLLGERLEWANAATFSRGRLFFDRAYTIKLAALYRAPRDFRLAAVTRYQDGQPFSRMVVAAGLRQGPEAVPAIPNGRARFTYTLTMDARLEKGFRRGRRRVAAILEAFNVLGMANEVEEDVVWGPGYRAVTAVQPPRAFRLGLRLDF